MDDAKAQLADKLKTAANILVTVSRDPSVDQLSALLGMALLLNKQNKHAAAVFSGRTPSTIEFLKPDETFEKNTDSLRDFIIALDKNKADKLRYKVEDNVVRIFITPYKTSISQDDFEFSQGDFNVDLVVAIGVKQQEDLDEAIIANGRILHDATVASINASNEGGLGTINWHNSSASSLSEMVTDLIQTVGATLLDEQIATALLTGIVSETDRFRNDKTSPQTMSMSAALMSAGANQQLVADKLEEPLVEIDTQNDEDDEWSEKGDDDTPPEDDQPSGDGTIDIAHEGEAAADEPVDHEQEVLQPGQGEELGESESEPEPTIELPSPQAETAEEPAAEQNDQPQPQMPESELSEGTKLIVEPPSTGGILTSNSTDQTLSNMTGSVGFPVAETPQLADHQINMLPALDIVPPTDAVPELVPIPAPEPLPVDTQPPAWVPPAEPTLSGLEESVASVSELPTIAIPENLNDVRDEVNRALAASSPDASAPEAIQALNAQPFGGDLRADPVAVPEPITVDQPSDDPFAAAIAETAAAALVPEPASNPAPTFTPSTADPATAAPVDPPAPLVIDSNAPPPVPPPIPFQFGIPPQPQ